MTLLTLIDAECNGNIQRELLRQQAKDNFSHFRTK